MGGARSVGPVHVRAETAAGALNYLSQSITNRTGVRVAFANTHLLYHAIKDRELARALKDFLVLNDGVGMSLASHLACGAGFPENLNGTDFTPRLLAAAPSGTRVYLYGGRAPVADRARVQIAKSYPHLILCGARHGYCEQLADPAAIEDLTRLRPDLVLVALGNPRQENFITLLSHHLPEATFVGVGALFDFIAGEAPRAPNWMRQAKLEWLFRLAREPTRLWRRYTIETLVVTASLLRSRFSVQRGAP